MKRPAAPEKVLDRVRAWRVARPDITLRSTFIVGFPGETEAEFDELLAFLREAQLDRVGCFAYSPVDGAAANALPDPVPEAVKEERRARFMAVQAGISAARLRAKVGQTLDVLVDAVDGGVAARALDGGRAGNRRPRPDCRRRGARAGSVRARARHGGGRARPAREKVGSDDFCRGAGRAIAAKVVI